MAQEKILDMTKSAASNETAVNNKFEELSQQGGGSTSEQSFIPETVASNAYGDSDFGDIEANNQFSIGALVSIFNSIRLTQSIRENTIRLNGTLGYTHCPTVRIHNGIAYIAFFRNTGGTDHLNSKASIHLSIVDITTKTMVEPIPVLIADSSSTAYLTSGDSVTLTDGALDPNMWIDQQNGIVRVTFTAHRIVDSTDEYYICYRDYNIMSGVLGDINACKILVDDVPADFSEVNFRLVSPDTGKTYGQMYMTSQYGELDGWLYICLATGRNLPSGFIFRTKDFITFEPVGNPYVLDGEEKKDASINLKYEMALHSVSTAWGKKLRFAARTYGENMVVGTIETDGCRVSNRRAIHDGNSRQCWVSINGSDTTLYLIHNIDSGSYRNMTGVEQVRPQSLEASNITRVATTFQMIYPSVVGYEGYLFVAYMRGGAVFLSRIPLIKKAYEILPTFERMLDVFTNGTIDYPIEYTNSMNINLEEGKFYKQNNVVYRCVFSSALTNRAALSTFVGKNLEVVS